jgi:phenylpropionate dioxygenase-like ring-hydroxylating dioxygenase large terminal subunit
MWFMYPFKEGSFAVRNAWYVAAFAANVGRDLVSRTILGEPVVLYRKENGVAVAIGGRCPHRHFPLGKGCIKGDTVVCGYHGITFGSDGACVSIPSQETVPSSYRVPTFPLVEHGLWLWIWMGDPAAADLSQLPPLHEILPKGMHSKGLFFVEVGCRYQLLNDNLLDLTHLGYLHRKTIGTALHASVPESLTETSHALRSRREIKGYQPSGMSSHAFGYPGKVDSIIEFVLYAPGFHSGVGDHFVAQDSEERSGEALRISRSLHAITPSTRHTSYYHFAVAATAREDVDTASQTLRAVIDEDVFAAEEIEKLLNQLGHAPSELMLKSDRNAVQGRRMLQLLMDCETRA